MHASEPREGTAGVAPAPLVLHQFPYVWGRNVSPFCLKLEAFLRLAGVRYTVAPTINPGRGPKGKLPFVTDGDRTIADSSIVIEHLKRRRGVDLDGWLDPPRRAVAQALQRLLEDHLYFVLAYSRWIDENGWPAVREGFFAGLPAPARLVAAPLVRRRIRRALHAQGAGRHSQAELYAMGRADLEAAAAVLGDKPFFLGERPSTIDAIAYGILANIYFVPVETELKRLALGLRGLRDWCAALETTLAERAAA